MAQISRFGRRTLLALAGFLALAHGAPALAQDFPSKTIVWLVGQPAGSELDELTRLVARDVAQRLGQDIVVDNRPGAAGVLALNAAARAPADGHMLISIAGPQLGNQPVPRIGAELHGVATLARGPMVLIGTREGSAPSTLSGVLAAARKQPDAFTLVSSGNGSSDHLASLLLNKQAHARFEHVAYRGGSQAASDVVGGQANLGMLGVSAVQPHIEAGRLTAYGVTARQRLATLPDVPTLAEAGLPGFEAEQWFVVAAPRGVPADRLDKLNAAIGHALHKPEIRAAFIAVGMPPASATPQQTTDFARQDLQRWQALAREAGLPMK